MPDQPVPAGMRSTDATLPTGTVTFLFTDVEGSTVLLREAGASYGDLLAEHRRLLRAAFETHGGREVDTQGDSFFVAFESPTSALAAAVDGQQALAGHPWPRGCAVRVRMGLHTGEATEVDGSYVSLAVHRAARIAAAGHGGQVLLSEATAGLVRDGLPDGVTLHDLGEHRLKDFPGPARLYQVDLADLPVDFPPLRTAGSTAPPLPRALATDPESPPRSRQHRTRRVVVVGAVGTGVVAAGVAVALLLTSSGSSLQCAFPDGFQPEVSPAELGGDGARVPDEVVVSALESDVEADTTGEQRLQELVSLDTSKQLEVQMLGEGAAPTISPDRRQIIFLYSMGELREPRIMDVESGDSRRFTDHADCTSAARPSWSQSGAMVAMVCQTEQGDERKGIYVFDSDGTFQSYLPTRGTPSSLGATTWIGDSAIVYAERADGSDQTRLWMYESLESDSEPVQLTSDEKGTQHINPDWSPERQALLFLRRGASGAQEGAIFTCGLEGDAQQWGEGQSFVAPTWSPDGSKLAFLVRDDDGQTLFWSPYQHADRPVMWQELVTEANGKKPLPPAWGSR